MSTVNKTRYAILGVLSLMNGSGYDIKKFCDKSISHFWSENFGHIYPVLNQLEEGGLIAQVNSDTPERRKVYGITPKGKKEFIRWLTQPVEYQPLRSELLLKISFGSYVDKEKTVQMLREAKERKKKQLEEYINIETTYRNDETAKENDFYPYWLAPLRYGILSAETSIRWFDETIKNIEKHAGR